MARAAPVTHPAPAPTGRAEERSPRERGGAASKGGWAWLRALDGWLDARRGRVLLGVVLVAAVLRALYWSQVSRTPGFGRPLVDAMDYERMARGLAAGTWPGNRVFFVDPLYVYWIALWKGAGAHAVLLAQLVLGALGAGVLARVAWELLRPSEALLAGLLAASYRTELFFETLELKTSLAVFIVCLLLLALVRARGRGAGAALGAGLVLGIGALLRGNLLALGPVAMAWLASARPRRWSKPLALLAGTLLALAPATLHNLRAGDLVLTTSNLGANLYTGNGPHNTTGSYVPPPRIRASPAYEEQDFRSIAEEEAGRALRPSEVSAYWTRETLRAVSREPERVAWLLTKKALLFLNNAEIPDNASFARTQRDVALLRAPLPSFALVLVLAGFALALGSVRRESWLALGLVLTIWTTVTVFFVNARFRMPAVPGLMLLAASLPSAVERLLARGGIGRTMARLGFGGIVAGGLGVLTSLPLYDENPSMLAANDAMVALEAGRLEDAHALVDEALVADPNNWRAELLRGELAERGGDAAAAEASYRRATAVAPREAEVWLALGTWLAGAGQTDEARDALGRADALADAHSDVAERTALQLADVERRLRDTDAARERLEALLTRRPHRAQAWYLLGRVELDARDLGAAEAALRRATEEKPDSTRFALELARTLRAAGKDREALEAYREALALDPANPTAQRAVRELEAAMGDG